MKRQGKELKSDEEILKEKKNHTHEREESLRSAINYVLILAIIGTPAFIALVFMVVVTHYLLQQQYDKALALVFDIGKIFFGYLIAYAQKQLAEKESK